ncbi:16S rRNA (cytosine(967)-C(5))-methyltransferase RsmB [Magnetovirga frankeli]|uniref:16S rRNA (cytosine(967)-C(5))-methyltransferase RsmB n=1 Tax=Magnetovirga frankeli TaxID=947516 RepID=UPI001293CB36|nr:16S rRNA (cytosine(967)-C(5))-methyltransferase RsmB [gamma proteobacterium SS-5]
MALDSRSCAARVLAEVVGGRSLTEALQVPCVAQTDPSFVQALCYGVLRQYPRYPLILQRLLAKPLKPADADIQALLESALFQLEQMRVPAHAAINESVQATHALNKKWAAGLVNAVLRRYQREAKSLQAALQANPEFAHALPGWLLQRLQRAWPEHWQAIAAASAEQGPLCLRVNRQQIERKGYFQLLQAEGPYAELAARLHPCAPDAILLERAVAVERLPGFAEGLVSVQDAGAQLAAPLLDPQPGEVILDACAAPGGKACHLLELAEAGLELTALDLAPKRLARVEDNLKRLGLSAQCRTGDVTAPAGAWAERQYAKILLDAPCSASGVIRRHPDIKRLRRDADIAQLAGVQQQALRALWPLLQPGGHLLYATCSILPEENEQQIARFLASQQNAREVPIQADWGQALAHGRQILPGEADMDGFYYALLEKTAT